MANICNRWEYSSLNEYRDLLFCAQDHGDYGMVKGFEIQRLGHIITVVFDPNSKTETGFISSFVEPEEFLTYKRGRWSSGRLIFSNLNTLSSLRV